MNYKHSIAILKDEIEHAKSLRDHIFRNIETLESELPERQDELDGELRFRAANLERLNDYESAMEVLLNVSAGIPVMDNDSAKDFWRAYVR